MPTPPSGEIESSTSIDRVQQFLLQDLCVGIPWQLQKVDAGASTWQPDLVIARVPNTEFRVQMAEAQERRSWSAGDKLEHLASVFIVHFLQDLPE